MKRLKCLQRQNKEKREPSTHNNGTKKIDCYVEEKQSINSAYRARQKSARCKQNVFQNWNDNKTEQDVVLNLYIQSSFTYMFQGKYLFVIITVSKQTDLSLHVQHHINLFANFCVVHSTWCSLRRHWNRKLNCHTVFNLNCGCDSVPCSFCGSQTQGCTFFFAIDQLKSPAVYAELLATSEVSFLFLSFMNSNHPFV